jgi:endonuclease/exonuclease/phosphatase family metal-dependent hydrolase
MSKILFFLFFPFFLFATTIKIASYNVENLFDMNDDGNEYKEYRPNNKHEWRDKHFRKKLLNISEVICELNADIIGLQEIENKNVLKELQKSLKKFGCIYQYSAITHKKNSAIQVAILSRFPIQKSKEIIVKRALKYRNILEVQYIIDGNPLFIYVNHWTSKRSKESKRIVSANALKKRLELLAKGSEYILLGDFNSDYDEYLHIEKKHNDRKGKTGINHILKTINSKNFFVRKSTFRESTFEHYNLWLDLPNYKRWSHNFYGNKQGLDAIILPSTLFDGKGIDYVDNSFMVLKKNYLFHKKGYIFRWVYKNKKHKGEGYSDHLPVVATFSTTQKFKKSKIVRSIGSIDALYRENPKLPFLLKKIKVTLQEKKKVLVSQENSKKTIAIYGTKEFLSLGESYDIMVYNRKLYNGHYEIIDFEIEKRYDSRS